MIKRSCQAQNGTLCLHRCDEAVCKPYGNAETKISAHEAKLPKAKEKKLHGENSHGENPAKKKKKRKENGISAPIEIMERISVKSLSQSTAMPQIQKPSGSFFKVWSAFSSSPTLQLQHFECIAVCFFPTHKRRWKWWHPRITNSRTDTLNQSAKEIGRVSEVSRRAIVWSQPIRNNGNCVLLSNKETAY